MAEAKCRHGNVLCSSCIVVDDAAKRAYDITRGIATFAPWEVRTRQSPWIALRLSDGGYDGVCYDTRRDAVRHQLHEQMCAYFTFRDAPNGFESPKHAAVYLKWHRMAYDAGMRNVDPEDPNGGPELIMPTAIEHLGNQMRRLILPGSN